MFFCCFSQQSCSFLTVHNNSVFIVHLKVRSDISFNFPVAGGGKKNCVCARVCVGDKRWPPVLFSPLEKTISDEKGDVWYLKMYIKWCQRHPRGQRRVPMETESGCCARRLDTPLSGGSVMALSFSRHVPGSFDTGNMHAG